MMRHILSSRTACPVARSAHHVNVAQPDRLARCFALPGSLAVVGLQVRGRTAVATPRLSLPRTLAEHSPAPVIAALARRGGLASRLGGGAQLLHRDAGTGSPQPRQGFNTTAGYPDGSMHGMMHGQKTGQKQHLTSGYTPSCTGCTGIWPLQLLLESVVLYFYTHYLKKNARASRASLWFPAVDLRFCLTSWRAVARALPVHCPCTYPCTSLTPL